MIQRAIISVPLLALVMSAAGGSSASAPVEGIVSIAVDALAPGAPLEPVWAFYGHDEANYATTAEGEELLRMLTAAHATPVRVRTHFLFNTGDGMPALKWGSTNIYTESPTGTPVYDYALIDGIMDATLQAGALPFLELGFMPQALSTRPSPYQNSNTYSLDGGCFYPPRDYEEWARLVGAWATHVQGRYPSAESSWQWELWNEPDIGYWRGTFEEYAQLYDYTEAALHGVLPGASLGGPAVASPEGAFLTRFLEHCATGVNAVTGQTGTRLDMVSFHAKGGVTVADGHVQMAMGEQLRLHRVGFEAVAASEAFASVPIVISEADPDGCAACPVSTAPQHAYRNSPAYGAYEVAMMKHTLDLARDVGVNLRGVLTWAFTFPGSPYFAGYRALATNGIRLPVLNALQLLASLRGARLPVTSNGARPLSDILANGVREQPDIDALAAVDGDRVRILVWNYHDDLVEAEPAHVTLSVKVPFVSDAMQAPTAASLTHTRVDEMHGDAFTVWESLGRPALPSDADLVELRQAMDPVVLSRDQVVPVADGSVSLSFDLPRFGVSLLELAPSEPGQAGTTATSHAGCSVLPTRSAHSTLPVWFALTLAVARFRRRSHFSCARSAASKVRPLDPMRLPRDWRDPR